MTLVLALAAGGVFLALFLAAYVTLAHVDARAGVLLSLKNVADMDLESQRDRELLDPLRTRALHPMMMALSRLAQRLTPAGYVAGVRRKLILAGLPDATTADRFLALRLGTVVLVPIWALVFFKLPVTSPRLSMVSFLLMTLVSLVGPDAVLSRKVAERKLAMQQSLPDILDLLTISVEAGLGFEQALDRTVSRVPGPLSEEFRRFLGEVRAGASRADAMRALDRRTDVGDVRSFVLSILQADTFGISIGHILRAQSEEMRIRRRQMAQERAQKAPVKMLFPMVFCIFPIIFVVVLGPGAINVYEQFLGK